MGRRRRAAAHGHPPRAPRATRPEASDPWRAPPSATLFCWRFAWRGSLTLRNKATCRVSAPAFRGAHRPTRTQSVMTDSMAQQTTTTSLGARCGRSAQAATGPWAPPEPRGRTASRPGPRRKERWAGRGRGSARRPTRPEAARRHLNAIGRAVSPPWAAGHERPDVLPPTSNRSTARRRRTSAVLQLSVSLSPSSHLASQTLSAAQIPYTFPASHPRPQHPTLFRLATLGSTLSRLAPGWPRPRAHRPHAQS